MFLATLGNKYSTTMYRTLLMVLTTLFAVTEMQAGGPLPQFDYQNFVNWTYNNQGYPLTSENISMNRIRLYGDLALTSNEFDCRGMDSIKVRVQYVTDQFADEGFDLDKVALYVDLLDENDEVADGIVIIVPKKANRQYLNGTVGVKKGLSRTRMRFMAPMADINCTCAITKVFTTLKGDLNGDCSIDVTDLNLLIDAVINGNHLDNSDIDGDGFVDVTDISILISKILGNPSPDLQTP